MSAANKNVIWFEDLSRGDVGLVGGKNSSLGEMVQQLGQKGIDVPPGFATTSDAFRAFIKANNLNEVIADAMEMLDSAASARWPKPARRSAPPLSRATGPTISARRSCRPTASCPNAPATPNSPSRSAPAPPPKISRTRVSPASRKPISMSAAKRRCSSTCRRCYASLFTDRAITYRKLKGFDHNQVALSIGVQLMVRSDIGGSGVMFSIDTESGFDKVVLINAAWGLGENVVQGAVTPDEYEVFKPLLDKPGLKPIVEKTCGAKEIKMIYAGTEGGEDQERADLESRARRLCALRRGDPQPRPPGGNHREALRPADGHGMGQGWRDRQALHRPGPARNGAVAHRCDSAQILHHQEDRQDPAHRPFRRRRRPRRKGLPDRERQGHRQVRRRLDPGDIDHRPRLGPDHEARHGDRHRSRRPHLACRHRQPRTGTPGHRRHRQRHPYPS
jgi:hypothetical protein